MKKILTIAIREYKAMVGTKAFLLSIIMMPVLMLGGLLAIQLLNRVGEVKERKIAVSDADGQLLAVLQKAAKNRNASIEKMLQSDDSASPGEDSGGPSLNRAEKFFLEAVSGNLDQEQRLAISEQIRDQELYALLEIPAGVTPATVSPVGSDESEALSESGALDKSVSSGETPSENASAENGESLEVDGQTASGIRFYSQDSGLSPARGWLQSVISDHVKTLRLQVADVDPRIVAQASQPVSVRGMGLVSRSADGSLIEAEGKDVMAAIFLPMGVMMLMFMVIFMASQPMLESVLEEKSQRIAEVLLGSANPFQIMSGKLIGSVAGSITIFSIYLVGVYLVAQQRGMIDEFPMHLVPWFVVFQILGVLFYAAIFLAVGASVTQLKEAQSLLLPVWMLLMSPMFIWIFIVQDPNGTVAKWFSLFPPATPTTMMLRMSTGQTIPVWQPITGVVLTAICTLIIVLIAGRIFRVGILWQGKTPKLSELVRWGITG